MRTESANPHESPGRKTLARLLRELGELVAGGASSNDKLSVLCRTIESRILEQPSAAAYEIYRATLQAQLGGSTQAADRTDFIDTVEQRFQSDPSDFDNLFIHACLLADQGQLARARQLLDRIARSGYAAQAVAQRKLEEVNGLETNGPNGEQGR